AFMNFSWYDCREPRASRLAIDLPNGGGWFWMPFRISADASPACHGSSDDYTVTERGPFSAAGLSWAPSLDFISAEVNIVAPRSTSPEPLRRPRRHLPINGEELGRCSSAEPLRRLRRHLPINGEALKSST